VRNRWFGATGVQVPEIAVEDEAELPESDALVVDNVSDVEALRRAHEQGVAVVVRADSAEGVQAALERPEVACVLVPADKRALLELDFRRLKYG
jgi:predicted HAD superfamily phosphohydrolase